uniref:Uncharacterized protein n=1 Tax=Seriola lalandi dorsalis TaxID=1841481 RepID=A0A3B4WLP3_SERLL
MVEFLFVCLPGASVNAKDHVWLTPLHRAAASRNELLVSRSADKSCKDKQGYTPLHAAAASGHIEIVKYLLRMGTEVSDFI